MFSRGGSMLPSSYADARCIDDVIAIEGRYINGQTLHVDGGMSACAQLW